MYEQPGAASLSQGDIVDECPILVWNLAPPPLDLDVPPEVRIIRVVVLTQACDLAQDKTGSPFDFDGVPEPTCHARARSLFPRWHAVRPGPLLVRRSAARKHAEH